MGLRSGLPHLGPPRRCVADLAAPIQLAPAAQQSKIKSAHQPPRSCRGQPVEAPHLEKRKIVPSGQPDPPPDRFAAEEIATWNDDLAAVAERVGQECQKRGLN